MKAPIVAWPLGLFDCCGVSDGAAAAIVTRADMAKNFRTDPIYIKGLQISVGARQGCMRQDYDYVHIEENVLAAKAGLPGSRHQGPQERDQHRRGARLLHLSRIDALRGSGVQPERRGEEKT